MKNAPALILLLLLAAGPLTAGLTDPWYDTVPNGLGVNTHFTSGHGSDLDRIRDAGFRYVRQDLRWAHVEYSRHIYDFWQFDQLMDDLTARDMGIVYILDYNNPLYGEDLMSIRTEAGRRGFADFAAASAEHYRGRRVIFEIWNEPNNDTFWQPGPNVSEYMALVKATAPAMKAKDPDALIVAPASAMDLNFILDCIDAGVLDYVDGLSLHPYTTVPEYYPPYHDILRLYIAMSQPGHADVPFVTTEWGFTSAIGWCTEEEQAKYLLRGTLLHLSLGIPVAVWYDYQDTSADPYDRWRHFGIFRYDGSPKPAHAAMQTLVEALEGLRFVQRRPSAVYDYLLEFSDGACRVVAAWTVGAPHSIELVSGIVVDLTDTPQFISLPAHGPPTGAP